MQMLAFDLLKILPKEKYKLDELRIIKIIAFHDILEAGFWDIDAAPIYEDLHKQKKNLEKTALDKIKSFLSEENLELLLEYENQKTLEAKFVKVVDRLDSLIHCYNEIQIWKKWKWTKEYFIETRKKYFDVFPEFKAIFYFCIDSLEKRNFFYEE